MSRDAAYVRHRARRASPKSRSSSFLGSFPSHSALTLLQAFCAEQCKQEQSSLFTLQNIRTQILGQSSCELIVKRWLDEGFEHLKNID